MSTVVDQRVVQMQFDNRQFESGVSTTMSTLDKLKQKLNFTGASKGLENINAAAKNVNMTGLSAAVQTVQSKFSAMEVVGVTALANITNSAVNAGKRMVSALTIDPIKTGFQEYETQINSTQTILANTKSKGSTIDDVNKALEELNLYADKTIYNFTEMTRNIGTFTAAGIDLDTSVNAIQGIANLAAVSGSTSQQASTAMYQLSQALASGTVKLMDWNSVVNAGMGGELFQNALKETSKLLGTGAEAAIKTTGSFRESLREGWLTAEVLTETLKKFTTTGANEYIAEYTGLTKEAVEAETKQIASAKDTAKAIDEAAEALAKKSGKNKDEIKSALEFAQTAEDAATKVKTFSQLWDVMKESAQSGWAQTWKILVGDFEEAKALLTPLADVLTGFIGKMSDARNKVLELALDNPFTDMMDRLKGITGVTEEMINVTKDYGDIVNKVMGGEYGTGQARWDKLAEEGYNWAKVQNLVNEQLGSTVRHNEEVAESQKKVNKVQGEANKSREETIEQLADMSYKQLHNLGYTNQEIEALYALKEASEKTGIPIKDLVKDMDQLNGRTLLINSFKNIGQSLIDVFTALKDAWQDVFPPKSVEERAAKLYDLIAAFHKFTLKLQVSDDTADKLQRTFKGVFAIVDVLTTILGGGFKIAFKVLTGILSYFNMDILDLTAHIGDALVAFRDWFDSLFDVSGALDIIVPTLKNAAKAVKGWIDTLKKLPGVQKLVSSITSLFDTLSSVKIGNLGVFDKLLSWINKLTGRNFESLGQAITEGLIGGIADGVMKVVNFIAELATAIIQKFKDMIDSHSPSKVFMAIGGFIISGLILGIKEGLISVPESLQGIVDKCVAIFQNIDWGTIMALGISVAGLVFIKKVGDALENLSAPFAGIGEILENTGELIESFGKVTKAAAFNIRMKGIKQLAIAIAIIAGSIIALVHFGGDDYGKMWNAVGIITTLALVLAGLSIAMDKMASSSVSIEKGKFSLSGLKSGLLTMAAAIAVIAGVVYLLGKMDPTAAKDGFKRLGVIVVGVIGFVGILGVLNKVLKKDAFDNVDKIGSLMIRLGIAMALMVGVCKLISLLTPSEMVQGGVFALAFLGFVALLAKVSKLDDKHQIAKLGGMMVKIAIAMGLMVGVCKLIRLLDPMDAVAGAAFALAFVGFIWLLVKATKIGKEQQIAKLGGLLLSISLSMMLMVGVCKLIGMLTVEDILKGAAFIAGFTIFVGTLVAILKIGNEQQIAKVAGTIIAISVAVGILAAVAMLLSLLSVESLIKGVTAVSILGIIMAVMVKSLQSLQGVNKDNRGAITSMAVTIALMAVAVAGLSFIDPKRLAGATTALTVLMGMFALMIKTLGALKDVKKITGVLVVMTIVVGLLAGILWGLSALNVETALPNAAALSVLLLTMTGVLAILSKLKTQSTKALTGIGLLTLMVVPMMAFIAAIHFMPDISGAKDKVLMLSQLMSVMTVLLAAVSLIGKFLSGGIISGIVGLTAMAIPLFAFAIAISYLPADLIKAKDNVLMLTQVMTVMTGLLAILAIVGLGGPAALIGIGSLVALIIAMGALTAAVGWLMEKFPKLEEFIDRGIPVLVKLAEGMGMMIGRFTGALAEGFADSLVAIGEDISQLMQKLAEASEHAKGIDGSAFDGVGQLIKALIGVSVTAGGMTLVDAFTSIVGGEGQGAIDTFKTEALALFSALGEISTAMTDAKLPEDFNTAGVTKIIDALKQVAAAMVGVSIADMFSKFTDQTAMEKFETDGKQFFKAIKAIATEMVDAKLTEDFDISGLTKLLDALKQVAASMAGISLADMFTNIVGDQTAMEKFEADGKQFFKAIKAIAIEMVGAKLPKDFDISGLTKLLEALKSVGNTMIGVSFADMFTNMVGDSDSMTKFQTDGVAFFKAIKAISTEMTGFTFPADFSTEGLTKLLQTLQSVSDYTIGASWGDIFTLGGTSIEKFQADGVGFFSALKAMSTEAAGINMANFSIAESAITKIKEIFASVIGVDYSGVAEFTGIGTGGFGADGPMHDIGVALKDFGEQVAGINTEAVSISVDAAHDIRTIISSLSYLDTSGIENFKAKEIGSEIKDYNKQVEGIDTAVIASSITSAKRLISLINSLVGIDNSGVALFNVGPIGDKIKAYADSVAGIDAGVISSSISAANRLRSFITSLVGFDGSGVSPFKTAVEELGTVQVGNIVQAFTDAIPKLSVAGAGLIDGIARGMRSKQGVLTSTVSAIIAHLVSSMNQTVNVFGVSGRTLMDRFTMGIRSRQPAVMATINAIINIVVQTAKKLVPLMGTTGAEAMGKFAQGLRSQNTAVSTAMTTSMASAIATARGYYGSFYSAGSYLVDGFAAGISENDYKAAAKASAMATAAKEAAEEALGIQSPSKVFYAIGEFVGKGFTNALGDYNRKVYNAGSTMADQAKKGMTYAIGKIHDIINSDMDAQPTIRPVLDLSNVQSGAAAINGMFSGGATVGVQANVNSISSMMNDRIQNGVNDDIISAINKLGNSLSNVGGTTYSINGITYDDGSNISDAIKTIARHAKMERRI